MICSRCQRVKFAPDSSVLEVKDGEGNVGLEVSKDNKLRLSWYHYWISEGAVDVRKLVTRSISQRYWRYFREGGNGWFEG